MHSADFLKKMEWKEIVPVFEIHEKFFFFSSNIFFLYSSQIYDLMCPFNSNSNDLNQNIYIRLLASFRLIVIIILVLNFAKTKQTNRETWQSV